MEDNKLLVVALILVAGIFIINYAGEYSGLAVRQVRCEDEDGSDIHYRGALTYTYGRFKDVYVDSCINSKVLKEHYCISQYKRGNSPVDCPYGEVCDKGRCLKAELKTGNNGYFKTIDESCIDSDEGSIYERGVVYSDLGGGKRKTFVDICVNSRAVSEYDCKSEGVDHRVQDCPSGYFCKDGACVI